MKKTKKAKKKFTKTNLIIILGVIFFIGVIIWLSDVFSGNSDNPVKWSRELPRESIQKVSLSFWNAEGYPQGIRVEMTDEMIDELYDIIHDFRRKDFARGSVGKYDATILITCYNAEFLLEYKEGAAELTFDENTGKVYGGGRDWKIVAEELDAFIKKYQEKYFGELGITAE